MKRLPGVNFVLSDPAPALVGSLDQRSERDRKDGTKNYWSLAAVRLRANGDHHELILLDGKHSKEWPTSVGWDEICKLSKRWHANQPRYVLHEVYGGLGNEADEEARRAGQRNGLSLYFDFVAGTMRLPRFENSYELNAKILRAERLADWGRRGHFLISKECPEEFLYGDRDHTGFLTQIRKVRFGLGGKTNLKFDDDLDVVSRGTDSALLRFAPSLEPVPDESQTDDEFEEEEPAWLSRYCGV